MYELVRVCAGVVGERVGVVRAGVAGVVRAGVAGRRAGHVAAAAVGAAVLVADAAPRLRAPEPHHTPHHQQLRLQQHTLR